MRRSLQKSVSGYKPNKFLLSVDRLISFTPNVGYKPNKFLLSVDIVMIYGNLRPTVPLNLKVPQRRKQDGGVSVVGVVPEGGGGRPLPVGDGGLPSGGCHPLHTGPLRRRGDPRRGGSPVARAVSGADDEVRGGGG